MIVSPYIRAGGTQLCEAPTSDLSERVLRGVPEHNVTATWVFHQDPGSADPRDVRRDLDGGLDGGWRRRPPRQNDAVVCHRRRRRVASVPASSASMRRA